MNPSQAGDLSCDNAIDLFEASWGSAVEPRVSPLRSYMSAMLRRNKVTELWTKECILGCSAMEGVGRKNISYPLPTREALKKKKRSAIE